jgi:hypothetical protein
MTVGEGRRWQLDGVSRPQRSLAAGEGGSEVLQLEEKPREVMDHLAEEKGGAWVELNVGGGGDHNSGGLNAVRSGGGGSAIDADKRRRGRRGDVLARLLCE